MTEVHEVVLESLEIVTNKKTIVLLINDRLEKIIIFSNDANLKTIYTSNIHMYVCKMTELFHAELSFLNRCLQYVNTLSYKWALVIIIIIHQWFFVYITRKNYIYFLFKTHL